MVPALFFISLAAKGGLVMSSSSLRPSLRPGPFEVFVLSLDIGNCYRSDLYPLGHKGNLYPL
eukprot:9917562-Karenia_brevis.AAC.1